MLLFDPLHHRFARGGRDFKLHGSLGFLLHDGGARGHLFPWQMSRTFNFIKWQQDSLRSKASVNFERRIVASRCVVIVAWQASGASFRIPPVTVATPALFTRT
jgi:hypothetical protein